jgi:type IV secretory pathway VirB3-like protein
MICRNNNVFPPTAVIYRTCDRSTKILGIVVASCKLAFTTMYKIYFEKTKILFLILLVLMHIGASVGTGDGHVDSETTRTFLQMCEKQGSKYCIYRDLYLNEQCSMTEQHCKINLANINTFQNWCIYVYQQQ